MDVAATMKLSKLGSLVIAVGFAHNAYAAPDAKSDTTSADVARFVKFVDQLVDTALADKDACPKMAVDVNALIDANKDLLDSAKKAKAAGKTLPQDAKDHLVADFKKLTPAFQSCGNDANVQAAFKRLDLR